MSKRRNRIRNYPNRLRGFAINKYGGNQLQRERSLRGSSNLPPGRVRTYSKAERDEYERRLNEGQQAEQTPSKTEL